ncbi:alpha/beta fold hydrolase [Amycolatopsis benzoatilytica]|uniref:alpha/beta fold hydrolase n=1 Tax=Amycolatopsis benzoatilytica TaxID=346045 RepID=UPI001FE0B2AC|nr:alpha/beta hydrolase [Amycolatopsis benzoatilytica]
MTESDIRPASISFQGKGVRLAGDRWEPSAARRGTVLFLHGGGQTRHSWGRAAERVARSGWAAVTLDARGHGDSEWASDEGYSLDAFVDDLYAVIEALDDVPVLVGASLGGLTSLAAAGERPGCAAGVVLVDVTPRISAAGRERIVAFMAGAPNGFGSLEEVADAIHAYNPHRRRPRSLDGLRKNVRQRADGRWYWHWDPRFLDFGDEPSRDIGEDRLADAARAVRVPTMLVRGSESDIVTDESVEDLRRLVPGARFEEVSAGHMVAGDDNDVFSAQLVDFLENDVAGRA